ncbi:hypothetical protein PHYBOEH_011358 [Phytophthora boehmeriae]|uniref:RING-type domain-containing protein n=1 Tax=Phytophthora boehmeriae TaxID=109152 RepID=A0A8T1WZE8_9STRA|nr:hypothetical protein PHYBOEH_011358 [Phytophthora boehmeriae]
MQSLPRPDVVSAPPSRSEPSETSPGIRARVHVSSTDVPPASSSSAAAGAAPPSGSWILPPINQFMNLSGRFLSSRFSSNPSSGSGDSRPNSSSSSSNSNSSVGVSGNSPVTVRNQAQRGPRSATYGSTLDNLLNESDEEWPPPPEAPVVLPRHFHDMFAFGAAINNRQQPEEIDLTLDSDSEGITRRAQETEDSDGVVEILDVTDSGPQPAPLRRKRRRPAPSSTANAVTVPKRQRVTDMMRSAESTNISLLNNEVVEEFKKRLKCSVCLDVLENMTSTLCGHIFCAGCIHQAIRANGKCPLCQRHLHSKDTHRLYF